MQTSLQPASSALTASNSSPQGHASSDRSRRWHIPLSSSAAGNSNSSSPGRKSRESGTSGSARQAKATYSLSRGAKDSPLRPGSSSTVGSFSSAKGFYQRATSPYAGSSNLSHSRSSISSSSNRTFHDPLTRERDFENMLASGETRRLSETAEVAKSDSIPSSGSAEQHDSSYSTSSKRQQISDIPEALEVNARHGDEEDLQRTPTFGAQSFSSMPLKQPVRPAKAPDRSPSSTFSSLPSFPSNASGISSLGMSPSGSNKDLPVHPHHRNEKSQIESSSSSLLHSDEPPLPPAKSAKQLLGPSVQARPPSSSVFSATSGRASTRRMTPYQPSSTASPAFTSSSQATFTEPQAKSDPVASDVQRLHLEGGQSNASLSEKSASALKQRLKKTGGFLKRLGGGSNAEKSQFASTRSTKIVRKPSQSSMISESGVSVANSTKSAPGDYQSRRGKGTRVPVPSIPSRYHESTSKGTEKEENDKPPSGLPASNSAESQVSSSTTGGRGNKTPSSTSGSVGSATTEIRHALKAWEKEMDATLKQSGQDLEKKTKIDKPSQYLGPTPQLPEYRLNRKASFMDEGEDERGETELLQSSSPDTFQYGQLGKSSYDAHFLVPHQPQRAASLGIGLPSNIVPLRTIIHSDPLASKPTFPSSPCKDISEDYVLHSRTKREDNTSYASVRSYETAIDRPSYFVRHADRNEPSLAETVRLKEQAETTGEVIQEEGAEEMKPEASIRLITQASIDTDEGTAIDRTRSTGLDVKNEATAGHCKDKTVTQSDILRRSPSPLLTEEPNTTGVAADQSVDIAAKELAVKCWNEDETFKRKEKIAEWLGGISLIQQSARKHYMDEFDFAGLRIDAAFRKLCDKLFLRAETQQVDRILSAFGQRYFECNPQSILVNADVIHALVFSILLLNTDLHVADIQDRMTRSQFVRNTLAAILESVDVNFSQTWTNGVVSREDDVKSRSSLNVSVDATISELQIPTTSSTTTTPSSRLTPSRRISNDGISIAGSETTKQPDDPATRTPFTRAWEAEVETLLRDIYHAVKTDQIRLPITDAASLSSLAPRKPLRTGSDRVNALKRGSIRGIQGLLGSNALLVRSDENLSVSRTSLNSTQRSFSDYNATHSTPSTSFTSGSVYGPPPTLGFANTLSQSIIKEAKDEDDNRSIDSVNDDLTDDELALMGSPWAKEGMLTRKHYWEAPLKRARDKSWTECFVVVQKGMFSMFRFGDTSSNGNSGANTSAATPVEMGGGNWLSNATCVGEYPLAHTLANSLPPPGYNRSRPHVFALTLPNGSVFFFQTGHEELVQEWVSTCNYWAARQSREPLAGGVSNMEYGWNRVLPTGDHEDDDLTSQSHVDGISPARRTSTYNSNTDTRSIRSGKSGKSLRMRVTNNSMFQSWQSSADKFSAAGNGSLNNPSQPSMRGPPSVFSTPDRPFYINEWRAPAPPTVSSALSEEDQLEACKRHKSRVEAELTEHNTLRQPMMDYFASCNPPMPASSVTKAIANFDRKASYLLSDLTKFTLYTATLASANKLKLEKRDERQLQRMMQKADEESSRMKEEEEGPPLQV